MKPSKLINDIYIYLLLTKPRKRRNYETNLYKNNKWKINREKARKTFIDEEADIVSTLKKMK